MPEAAEKKPRRERSQTNNHELRIHMIGRQDRNEEDYYLATPTVPCLVDLSKALLLFFPGEEEEEGNRFSGELVIKLQRDREERPVQPQRRTTRQRPDK